MHELVYLMGLTSPNEWPYLFWSGFAAYLGRFALIFVLWRKFACHTPRCHRIAIHHVNGLSHCRKHYVQKETHGN